MPLKVAFAGIDRYFERYYRDGPRRRPVRIDFCEADVLDVFDEWLRAIGISGASVDSRQSVDSLQSSVDSPLSSVERGRSLPRHLERVVERLTGARAAGAIGPELDGVVDRIAHELDQARAKSGGVRGEARASLIARLEALDGEMIRLARGALDGASLAAMAREAEGELAPFRASMAGEAFDRARGAAVDRLVRERFGLPTVTFRAP